MQCISRHLQLTLVESALRCSCLEPLFSLGSQTACTQCTFSTLPGVIVPGTGSQPSYTASSEQAPIHFTAEKSMSGTPAHFNILECTSSIDIKTNLIMRRSSDFTANIKAWLKHAVQNIANRLPNLWLLLLYKTVLLLKDPPFSWLQQQSQHVLRFFT